MNRRPELAVNPEALRQLGTALRLAALRQLHLG